MSWMVLLTDDAARDLEDILIISACMMFRKRRIKYLSNLKRLSAAYPKTLTAELTPKNYCR